MVTEYVCRSSNKFFPRVRGTLEERFDAKVMHDTNAGCWLWCGDSNTKYGILQSYVDRKVKTVFAHRYAYERFVGPIPNGLQIDHKCRNTWCVNPHHLEPVTGAENISRVPKHLFITEKTHCPCGTPYNDKDVKRPKGRNRYRFCRPCERAAHKRYRAKAKV